MHIVVAEAKYFATGAHKAAKNFRKVTGEPYIVHPALVALTVHDICESMGIVNYENEEAAAWLHDTVEDANIDLADIEAHFNRAIYEHVDFLTDRKAKDKARWDNNADYRARMAEAPMRTQIIKLADIIANFEDIVESHMQPDPNKKFKKYRRFIEEKTMMLDVLTKVSGFPQYAKVKRDFAAFLKMMDERVAVA